MTANNFLNQLSQSNQVIITTTEQLTIFSEQLVEKILKMRPQLCLDELLTVDQAAQELKCTTKHIYNLIERGGLVYHDFASYPSKTNRPMYLIQRKDLWAYGQRHLKK
jgi:hypothetical protein